MNSMNLCISYPRKIENSLLKLKVHLSPRNKKFIKPCTGFHCHTPVPHWGMAARTSTTHLVILTLGPALRIGAAKEELLSRDDDRGFILGSTAHDILTCWKETGKAL